MEEKKNAVESSGEKEEKKGNESLKTAVKIIIGIVIVLLGLTAVIRWWPNLLIVFKGCIGLFLILVGAITIAIAKD
jgi:hypothetical protein